MAAELEMILIYLLLALATLLIISVIVLAMYVGRLRRSVTLLGSNPVNLVKLRPIDSKAKDSPSVPKPRPLSGTCLWMKESMESVVLVPSRRESPSKEVFRKNETDLFVANTASCNTFGLPTD